MTVEEITKEYLTKNGFDGLRGEEGCGCTLEDFMPCGECSSECEPARKKMCADLTEEEKEGCEGKPCEECTVKYLLFS